MEALAPSIEEWRRLFELVEKFKEMRSWEWMDFMDVFGVQDPDTGKICYFNIISATGEEGNVYGIGVYVGDEGLASLLDIIDGRYDEDEQFYHNDFIMIQITPKEFLEDRELEIIKKLGIKFRGKNDWVSFRRWTPGYLPRPINKEEAKILLSTLEQAMEICLMFKERPRLKQKGKTLIRKCKKEDSNIIWEDKWTTLDYPEEELPVYDLKDYIEKGINEINPTKSLEEWAIDFFFLPGLVKDEEGEEPYFPYAGVVVNNTMKFGINLQLFKYSRENRMMYAQDLFINSVDMTHTLPRRILVRDEDVYDALIDIACLLKIELEMVDRIDLIEDLKESIRESESKETEE
jgi:hypothetical protein